MGRLQVVSALIFDEQDRVLMTLRHPHVKRPSMWEFPGGKVEVGETQTAAIQREVREECGIEVAPGMRVGGVSLSLEVDFDLNLWWCTILPGQPEPKALEAQAIEWVDYADAILHRPLMPSGYLCWPAVRVMIEGRQRIRDIRHAQERLAEPAPEYDFSDGVRGKYVEKKP